MRKKKNKSWVYLLFSFLILIFFGLFFINFHGELPVEEDFDIEKYMGTWYSVYEFPTWFQEGCECTTAVYELNDDGTVRVINSCERYGRVDVEEGIAYPIEGESARFKIQFGSFPFAKGDYNVIDVDDDYSRALVGTKDRRYLWILSREREIDNDIFDYFALAEDLGYKTPKLVQVNQQGCSNV